MTIQLDVLTTEVVVTSREAEVKFDLAKVTHDILRSFLAHGVTQKIADAAASATLVAVQSKFGGEATPKQPDPKAWLETDAGKKAVTETAQALMEKAAAALYEGKWVSRVGTGTKIESDPVTKLALDKAKAVLMLGTFRPLCEKAKIKATLENLGTFPNEKVSAFFTAKAKAWVWNDATVLAWIKAQAEAGKADYLAQAREELAAMTEAAGDIGDIDDLLSAL